MDKATGFLLTRHWRDQDSGVELEFWLATEDGPRRVRVPGQSAVAFIPAEQREQAEFVLRGERGCELRELSLTDFHHRPVLGLYCRHYRKLLALEKRLRQHGVDVYEADVRPPERYLMERFITAPVLFAGTPADKDPQLLLDAHLGTLGHAYGDFPGHDSLWEMVEKTRGDILARMALVPRTLEARGLDAIPPLRAKLAQAGDSAAAGILDIILRDEVGHVEIGNRWYLGLCGERGLEPVGTYEELAVRYKAPVLKGPFNLEARRRAGFLDAELARYGGDSVSFDA